jgi:cell division protein FtsQ
MKKFKLKKIIVFVLWIIGISSFAALLGFVNAEEKEVMGQSINVIVTNESENSFIDENVVSNYLNDRKDFIVNQKLKDIHVVEIENALNTHPAIEKADVSVDINGRAEIKVTQRKPVVRIMKTQGESFYIDSKGKLMPLSDNYSARVPFANGIICESYSSFYNYSIDKIEKDTALHKLCVIDNVFHVAEYIERDTLLNSMIQQIYVNTKKEIELYATIGNHKIVFGNSEDIPEKFNKLKMFYKEGLNSIDAWNKYSVVNLKYKNQVVCTKK